MAKPSFYAYKTDKQQGIVDNWKDCETVVKGVPGAVYKKFGTQDGAQQFLDGLSENKEESKSVESVKQTDTSSLRDEAMKHLGWLKDNNLLADDVYDSARMNVEARLILMQDGYIPSPNQQTVSSKENHVYIYVDGSYNSDTGNYGYGIYMNDGHNERIMCGKGKAVDGGRNVEGEVAAAKIALETVSAKYDSVTLYHDYQGIGSWADHDWRANKQYTQDYAEFVSRIRGKGVNVEFKHVDGHTGNQGNELVDKLAKIGCGVPLTSSEKSFISKYKDIPGYPSGEPSEPQNEDSFQFE